MGHFRHPVLITTMTNRAGIAEMRQNGGLNRCLVCQKQCESTCSRCSEFYCSTQCQTVDWREHKYVCFRMPELAMNSSPNRRQNNSSNRFNGNVPSRQNGHNNEHSAERPAPPALAPTTFNFADAPKNNEDILLVYVVKANTFYIRSLNYDGEYVRNSRDFDRSGQQAKNLSSLPKKNDMVLVKHRGKFLRAVVLRAESDNQIEVALADIGQKVNSSLREMRELSEDLSNRLRYNYKLLLTHIPAGVPKESYAKLHDLVRDRTEFTLQFDGRDWTSATNFRLLRKDDGLPLESVIEVETKCPATTTTTMATPKVQDPPKSLPVEKTTSESTTNSISRRKVLIGDLTTETLPAVADLIVISNSSIADTGYVTVILKANFEKFCKLFERVDDYGKANMENQPKYQPKPDELCLAKFRDEWYRALCCPPRFCLIDYGCFEDIGEDDIRQFPDELNEPCYSFICTIRGFSRDQKVVDRVLALLAENSTHLQCICDKVDEEYEVTFPCFPPSSV